MAIYIRSFKWVMTVAVIDNHHFPIFVII